jgi:ADP-ribosyl-[dinitrogen reductase] hydrolase
VLTRASLADRAAGVLLGVACGDALGAGYEFGSAPLPPASEPVAMIGGGLGNFAPGEWTDDTAMTVAVAEVAATGADLRGEAALDAVAAGFARWFAGGPPDVGIQTRRVLAAAGRAATARDVRAAADRLHAETGRTAGNGSLMRTAPVALAHLGDDAALAAAATAVSRLTHPDPLAGEACVLWCVAIDRAVAADRVDGVRDGLALLPADRRGYWSDRLAEAERQPPGSFADNGFCVSALQAAYAAVLSAPGLVAGLEAAVRVGGDTDTVAAIAGALLGARWGAAAIPAGWRAAVHGWPGLRAADLSALALAALPGAHRE